LCQALGPAAPYDVCGVDCFANGNCGRRGWEAARAIDWQAYAQGEYVGHARLAHVPEYRLRVDDQLDMTYRLTREETTTPYRLNVGDEVRVESFTDPELNRDLILQPDGTITLRLLGQVRATGRTVTQLRDSLEELYKKYYKIPAVTVTPLKVNTKLEDLRATIDRRAGVGGQSQSARVTPEGTISLPAIGTVQAQGLTLPELQTELNECYRQIVEGIQIIPILTQRAPRYVYVLGEVKNPNRFELTGPTTALQAIGMAGSYNVGANLRQIVVFRRGDDWRLLATMIDLEGPLLGRQSCPKGEIWIDDSDVIIVPKGRILQADDFIDLVFTRGIYGVFPLNATLNFSKFSTL
jgi:polysaccharide export outer membrane protein